MRRTILLSILAVALISSFAASANAISYYYRLTANYPDGANVPLGAVVTVTTSTNDPRAYSVQFYWFNPANQQVQPFPETVYNPNHNNPFVASSTRTLNQIGDWDVYAVFFDKDGNQCYSVVRIVAVRHTSFNVIPEIPLIGTAGASVAMILGLTYKAKKKPQKQAA